MKLPLLKALGLALYVTAVMSVWSSPGLFNEFFDLVVVFTLAYCGIIVLSQLITTLVALSHWCVAESREQREANLTAPSVAFETESEAT